MGKFGEGAEKTSFQELQVSAVMGGAEDAPGKEVRGRKVLDWEDPKKYGETDLVTIRQAAAALGVDFEEFSQRVHDCNIRKYGSPFDIRTKPKGRLYARWWEARKWWKVVSTRKGYGWIPVWRETRAESFQKVQPLWRLAKRLGITTHQLHWRVLYDIRAGLTVPFRKNEKGRWEALTSEALNWWRDRKRAQVRQDWRGREVLVEEGETKETGEEEEEREGG